MCRTTVPIKIVSVSGSRPKARSATCDQLNVMGCLFVVLLPLLAHVVTLCAFQSGFIDLNASQFGLEGLIEQIVELTIGDSHCSPPKG